MDQQEAKNLITMEEFLKSLEEIISSFKSYVDNINVKVSSLEETIADLSNKVNENSSLTRNLKKDYDNSVGNTNFAFTQTGEKIDESLEKILKEFSKRTDDIEKQIELIKTNESPSEKKKETNGDSTKKQASKKQKQNN